MTRDALQIYLGDHLAGAAAGVEIARRIADAYAGTDDESELRQVADDVEADRRSLVDMREQLDMGRAPMKEAAAWVAEKATHIKLSDAVTGDPHLTRMLELEALGTGIAGKLALWRVLEVAPRVQALDVDLARLQRRAEAQQAIVDRHRIDEARAVFGNPRAT